MIKIHSLTFSAFYAGILFCSAAAQALFNFTIPSSANFGYSMAAAYAVMMIFVNDNGRAPEKTEKRKLAFGCTLGGLVVSLGAMVIINYFVTDGALFYYMAHVINESYLPLLAAMIAGVLALNYFVIAFVFGRGARKYQLKLEKTGNKPAHEPTR